MPPLSVTPPPASAPISAPPAPQQPPASNSIPSSATRDIVIHSDAPKKSKPIILLAVLAAIIITVIAALAILQPWKSTTSSQQAAQVKPYQTLEEARAGFASVASLLVSGENSATPDLSTEAINWHLTQVFSDSAAEEALTYAEQIRQVFQNFTNSLNAYSGDSEQLHALQAELGSNYQNYLTATLAVLRSNHVLAQIEPTYLQDGNDATAQMIADELLLDNYSTSGAYSAVESLDALYRARLAYYQLLDRSGCIKDQAVDQSCLASLSSGAEWNAQVDSEIQLASDTYSVASDLLYNTADLTRYFYGLTEAKTNE